MKRDIKDELKYITQMHGMSIMESVEYVKGNVSKYDHLLKEDCVANMCRSHLKILIVSIEANYEMLVKDTAYGDINLLDVVFYYRWFLQNMINKGM